MVTKRLGNFDFCSLENADELEGIDDRLALKMIVGDDESVVGLFGYFADARDPGSELFGGVKIVVALVGGDRSMVGEPGVVAAAVKPDVADGRSGLGGGRERAADNGLIDVAEAGVVLSKKFKSFERVPGGVANFDDERIVGEAFKSGDKGGFGFFRTMERERELEEDSAEFIRSAQNVEASADSSFVFRGGDRAECRGIVSESLPEFGGEEKAGIGGDTVKPLRGVIGTQGLVERSVDLDGVEKFSEKGGFVKTFGAASRIDKTSPVRIRPAGGADAKSITGCRGGQGFGCACG